MLRPERMSRVSITGSKRVMDDVIEAAHDLDLLHLSDYTTSIEGFQPGDPIEGADAASKQLVTVRSLKSILGVDEDYDGPIHTVEDDLEDELETVRQDVNELDDRRDDLQDELRAVEEEIDQLSFFVDLGIDLDLLRDYDSLEVAVGEGVPGEIEAELAESDIEEYAVETGEDAIAVFARVDDRELLEELLVSATFTEVQVPDGSGDPAEYLADRRHRKQQLESKLATVEDEIRDLRLEVGGFLLAAEEQLSIDVEKREAPLSFATTKNAFVAEGWLPTDEVDTLQTALTEAAGQRIEVEELERADYDEDGHAQHSEPVEPEGGAGGATIEEAASEDDQESEPPKAAADGGYVSISNDGPPVVQDNPGSVKPFEALVEIINRPKYTELDPTIILFLTFPAFFGFMIGDLGYGLLYMGLGYWLIKSFDSDVIKSLGGIGMWAGGFTAIFGILYGEIFGLHVLGEVLFNGNPPIHKGLQPHYLYYAQAWLIASVVVGVLHLVIGRVFDFVNNLHHGVKTAFFESGSWIIMTVGMWLWVFSTQFASKKPDFIYTVFASGDGTAIPLGFTGFDPVILFDIPGTDVGLSLWLALFFVGLGMGFVAEGGIVVIESITQAFGHVVSYTRLAAVLLAKAGMALAVNLLVFGAVETEGGEYHFITISGEGHGEVIFQGLLNGEGAAALILGGLAGIVILLLGHLLVLVLGITSAGLQAVRLEYVEFFGKFYEGGGTVYNPFGHERSYTAEK